MRETSGTLGRDFRIAELLEAIHAGSVVLPEFQRDFDWGDDRVIQLLATITRRWPAGSLLLQVVSGPTFFRMRGFDGGPEVQQERVRYAVLDGQQRLTALYHAVYDTGPYIYAVRAKALHPEASIDELEENIASFRRDAWDSKFRGGEFTPSADWIPFYAVRSPVDFFMWRDEVASQSSAYPDSDLALTLSDAYRHGLESFHTYQLPAVLVEDDLEPAAIARIFERVNRGGLTLSAFDLMVAKTFESGWNLRDKWSEAKANRPILEEFFGEDGMPAIRVIALKQRDSVRERDVLGLTGLAVRTDWEAAVAATADALDFLVNHCGVVNPRWLPYGGMVITLASLALEVDLFEHKRLLLQWFLSRAFALRYEVAANTVTVEEYHHLRNRVQGRVPVQQVTISTPALREATRKRLGAAWRAFMAALALNGAIDPVTGAALNGRGVPMNVLPRPGSTHPGREPEHLLVLNLLLVEQSTARRLSGSGVAKLQAALEELGAMRRQQVQDSQLLPDLASPMSPNLFLDGRIERLERFLRDRIDTEFVKYEKAD